MESQGYDFDSMSILAAKIGIVLIVIMGLLWLARCCIRSKPVKTESCKIDAKNDESPMTIRDPPPSLQLFGRSRSETISINVFAHIIHEQGHSWKDIKLGYRPEFLKNPKTGRCLEIDAYHPEMKVGIEYNGIQHYVFPNHLHFDTPEGKEAFEAGVERDNIKRDICVDRGIKLIEIPYWIDTCQKIDGKWVYKKRSDQEKWDLIRRYLSTRI